MGRVTFCNISRVYFFFFNTQNIKSNCQIIFLKRFHVIYFWRIFYSIPIVFIYKKFNIWYFLLWISWILHGLMQQLLHTENIIFIFRIFCCYFIFYSVCRINIWPPPSFKIYLVTFIIQQLNRVKNKITPSHWRFKTNLVSWKKWPEKFINNFICIMIWHKFYIVTFWVHYKLIINIFKKK